MHIHEFPNEIILTVFDDVYDSLDIGRPQSIYTTWETLPEVEWMRLMGVCRRWRDILCETPRYWHIINVYTKPRWLELCLSRSAGKKVLAVIHFLSHNFPPSLLHSLSQPPYISHIGVLSFSVDKRLAASLGQLFSRSFPNLHKLSIHGGGSLGLSHERLPRLANLTLSSVPLPEDMRLYNNLRVLDLSSLTSTVTQSKLLKVLAACSPKLESLRLNGVLSTATSTPPAAHPSVIIFPCLRTAIFSHPRPYNAHLLSSLRFPCATDIHIIDDISKLEEEEFSDLDQAFSALLPPEPATVIPFLSSITDVEFFPWRTEYAFTGRTQEEHTVKLELWRDSDYSLVWDHLTHPGVMDLLSLLFHADVRRFELEADYPEMSNMSEFEAAFKAFPNLETLRINGEGSFVWVLDILSRADPHMTVDTTTPSNPASGTDVDATLSENATGGVLCPKLKTLMIGDLDNRWMYDEDLLDHIVEILAARDRQGTRLDHFEIHLMHETEEDYEDASAKYVPQLQALVGEVVYGNHEYEERL